MATMNGTERQHISQVAIEDFQSLRRVALDLGAITIITGDNSKGKSAVLRAIAAAAFNRAGGDFVTRDQKQTRVTLRMGTGQTVTWTKPRNGGAVIDLDGQTISRAGKEYPPELAGILGFRELQLGTFKARLQFASQFDQPFMLASATGGQAAAVLCSVSRIDVVVAAIALARGDVRDAEQRAKAAEAEATALLAELDAMPDYGALLVRAEELQVAETECALNMQRVTEIQQLATTIDKQEALCVRWLALELPARVDAFVAESALLAEISTLAATVQTRTAEAAIDVVGLAERVEMLLRGVFALEQLADAVNAVRQRAQASTQVAERLEAAKGAATAAEEALLAGMVEAPRCPTCGQVLQ